MRVIATAYALLAATIALGASVGTQASAAELAIKNPGSQMELLTTASIKDLVTELGGQKAEAHDEAKDKSVTFMDGDVPFHLILIGCEEKSGGCLGMVMLVAIDAGATNHPLEAFNSFNTNNSFVTAVKLDGNKYAVTRMLVTEGGVTKKNVGVNIVNFAIAPEMIMKHLASQVVAGVQQDGAQLQTASVGTSRAQAIRLSPAELAHFAETQHLPKQSGLKRH